MTEAEWDATFIRVRKGYESLGRMDAFALTVAWMRANGMGERPGGMGTVPEVVRYVALATDLAALGALLVPLAEVPAVQASTAFVYQKLAALYRAAQASGIAPDPLTLLGSGVQEISMDWLKSLWKSLRVTLIGLAATAALAILSALSGADVTAYIKAHLGIAAPIVVTLLMGAIEFARNWVNTQAGKYEAPAQPPAAPAVK